MKFDFKYLYLFPLASLAMLTACDNVDDNDRYIAVEKPVLPPHSVPKTLLIEEFTGNRCVNCPTGAEMIHTIMQENPGRVIAIGVHPAGGGPNTLPIGTQDFRCDEAQVIFEQYKPDAFPCAVFNGTETSTAISGWYTIASSMLQQEANMTIDAISDYDPETRNLDIDYTITLTNDIDTQLSVMALIMENDIIGYQTNLSGQLMSDYVHNHVLRASLNGDWGQQLPANLANGDVIDGSASIKVDEKWVAENCQVVVFVFQTQSKAVEQAFLVDVDSKVNNEGPEE